MGSAVKRGGLRVRSHQRLGSAVDGHDRAAEEAGFASHAYLEARYGFSRGFDRYAVGIDQRAETVSRQAVAWLDTEPEPFFLFLHYFDPHWDYRPPIGFDTRFGARRPGAGRFRTLAPFFDPERSMPGSLRRQAMALYDGEIAYTDDQIGRVLERLRRQDRLDDTIVAVVSDHGEEFGDHGAFGHGTHLHAELTRIPFLLRFPPRIAAGTRPSALASLSDLPATLLSLAELEVPEQFAREGVAHFTREPGADPTGERQVFLESTRWGPKRFAVRTRTHKLVGPASYQPVRFERRRRRSVPIVSSPIERETALFDLTNDPSETADRIGDPAAAAALTDLRRALHAFVASTVPGVRLACRQATEASPEFTGVLRFAESLVDEPFPEPAISPARVATLGPLQFRVTLRAGRDAGGIVFPVSDAPGDVTVALARDADPLFAGSVRVPEPGGEQPLGAGAAGGCALRADFASGRHRGSVELDEEDLETLRALGYAQ
jgi:arylsulfatase A-like enzyme